MMNHSTTVGAPELATALGSYVTLLTLGARPDALALGLFSAIFVTIWLEQVDSKLKACAAILLAALLAGHGSPVAAEWISNTLNAVSMTEPLQLLCAVIIGATSPIIVPVLLDKLKSKGQGL